MDDAGIEDDGTVVSREMVVRERRTDFHGTTTYRTLRRVDEVLEEELESDPGGHGHLWFDVDCPTCGAPAATHCSGDDAERPRWMRDDDEYWDKPCAKRVVKAVLQLMEEADD